MRTAASLDAALKDAEAVVLLADHRAFLELDPAHICGGHALGAWRSIRAGDGIGRVGRRPGSTFTSSARASAMAERKLRVLSVFGTRPEAVKMAPVVLRLRQTPGVDSQVCVTAQHRQMLDQVLDLFHLKPDFDLDLMQPDQSLAETAAAVFTGLDPILERVQPDWVLVQGDTTTVAAAALAAYYRKIRLGHVEAGLRTGDKWRPFPEEINRRVAGVVADLHFAATTGRGTTCGVRACPTSGSW